MDAIYYVIIGMLALLSVSGLIVGVSNDACNFLNAAIGCKAAKRTTLLCFAAVGVVLGASFSSGMMDVARHAMFDPAQFTFHEMMLLYLAVMVANIVLMDIFFMLRLPTSTTVVLVFALLGSGIGMAVYASGLPDRLPDVSEYIRTGKAFEIICAIFASVAAAFVLGTTVMWLARLLFSFRYQKTYRVVGPFWCGMAFTAITYFALFKGLASSPMVKGSEAFALLREHVMLFMACAFVVWVCIAAFLQHICKLNTLRMTVIGGSFALALSFAGNDLVNFIGPFMAALACAQHIGDPNMGFLDKPGDPADLVFLIGAGVIMVGVLFLSKRSQKISQTELKLSSGGSASKERFGSSQPARVLVRGFLNTINFVERVSPPRLREFVGSRFAHLTPEEETDAAYDQIRGSVNLTIAAVLISVATSFKLPLSTTYVAFMVAMGSSLADRAWGRDSAVYRITGVLTVVGGWFLTAIAACGVSFAVSYFMAAGGFWALVFMMVLAAGLLIKSFLSGGDDKQEVSILDVTKDESVRQFGRQAGGRLGRMIGIYKAMVKALLEEDLDSLKRLRKKTRNLRRDIEGIREDEVLPTLRSIPRELADRGQLIFRVTEISLVTCECLLSLVKAAYNHIDNNHAGLNEAQAADLLALTDKIGRFYPDLTDMLKAGDFAGINAKLEDTQQLSDDFAEAITRHLMHYAEDESGMRTGILYLTLLNETRAMVSHAFALIRRIRELHEEQA